MSAPAVNVPATVPGTRTLTMVQAVNDALSVALGSDEDVLLFGQDVGMGGVFRASDGLRSRFGPDRVFDTPLSEAGIVGMGLGLALIIWYIILCIAKQTH